MRKNRDKLLGVAAVISLIIGSANAMEFFLTGKNYLDRKEGVVEKVVHETYTGRKRRLYARTNISLKGSSKEFFLTDNADDGGYIATKEGDTITIYARKWYQILYNYDFGQNIYYVEKGGDLLYNNLNKWKASAFAYMCFFGGCALFLGVMYLDQVKNISISNWFQKHFLQKKKQDDIEIK